MNLTPDELQTIDRHLRKENWLLNEELIAELTDHYANGIHDRRARGMSFDVALRDVHAGFGGRKGLLAMEEEYQIQKARQIGLDEWREVQTFFTGKRALITLGVFIALYLGNTAASLGTIISSFFKSTEFVFLVTMSVAAVLGMVQGWLNYRRSKGADVGAYMTQTSAPFVRVYAVCYLLLWSSRFVVSYLNAQLSASVQVWIATLTQTMATAYLTGSAIALYKLYTKKPRLA